MIIYIDPENPHLLALVRPYGLNWPRLHRLYRFRDAQGSLLYVGMTRWFPERWAAHRRKALWWSAVFSVEVSEAFPHQAAAEEAERQAIRAERPIHNRRSAVVTH